MGHFSGLRSTELRRWIFLCALRVKRRRPRSRCCAVASALRRAASEALLLSFSAASTNVWFLRHYCRGGPFKDFTSGKWEKNQAKLILSKVIYRLLILKKYLKSHGKYVKEFLLQLTLNFLPRSFQFLAIFQSFQANQTLLNLFSQENQIKFE